MKDFIISGAAPFLMPQEDPAGKIVFTVILLIALVLTYVALVTFLAAVLRGQTQRGRDSLQHNPLATMLYGFVGWALFGALAAWLFSQAFVERLNETEVVTGYLVAACIAVLIPMCICLLGAPGLYTYLGGRIADMRNTETSDLRRVVSGTFVAMLAACFPFVGWFLILPLLLVAEFGTGARALFR